MGSFFVTKNKRERKLVPKEAYHALGISHDMDASEATVRIKQLNKKNRLEKSKIAAAARRVKHLDVVKSAYIPEDLAVKFGDKLIKDNMGSEEHGVRLIIRWKTVQNMIADLEIEPRDYADEFISFYKYFIRNEYSLDYATKLLRITNKFGYFVSKKTDTHFEPIPMPRGKYREAINDAHFESEEYRGPSAPLTPRLLAKCRNKLPEKKGNWLLVSFAFGLRPVEVDDQNFRISNDKDGTTIVEVYQSKLVGVPKDERWKPIAIQTQLQTRALKVWQSGEIQRPHLNDIQGILGEGFHLYAGRKGFEKWLRDLGESFENVSLMLGHRKLDRTWKDYTNKKVARYSIKNKAG
jgi:hypothetical protein